MSSATLPRFGERPAGPVPDVHLYPEGRFRSMPSVAHERARALTTAQIGSVAAPTDLVASELAFSARRTLLARGTSCRPTSTAPHATWRRR